VDKRNNKKILTIEEEYKYNGVVVDATHARFLPVYVSIDIFLEFKIKVTAHI
jgi:hypothetical protein